MEIDAITSKEIVKLVRTYIRDNYEFDTIKVVDDEVIQIKDRKNKVNIYINVEGIDD